MYKFSPRRARGSGRQPTDGGLGEVHDLVGVLVNGDGARHGGGGAIVTVSGQVRALARAGRVVGRVTATRAPASQHVH